MWVVSILTIGLLKITIYFSFQDFFTNIISSEARKRQCGLKTGQIILSIFTKKLRVKGVESSHSLQIAALHSNLSRF